MRVMVPSDFILQHGSRVSSTLSKCTVHAVAIGITTTDGVITQRVFNISGDSKMMKSDFHQLNSRENRL